MKEDTIHDLTSTHIWIQHTHTHTQVLKSYYPWSGFDSSTSCTETKGYIMATEPEGSTEPEESINDR